MIPMMILSGAMFSYDKLNQRIGRIDKVPFIAEIMVTKWGYEALMVNQFKHNKFTERFYELEQQESIADFKKVYWLPEMKERLSRIDKELRNIKQIDITRDDFKLVVNEIAEENKLAELIEKEISDLGSNETKQLIKPVFYNDVDQLDPNDFSIAKSRELYEYLKSLETFYSNLFQLASRKRQNMITYYLENKPDMYQEYYDSYFNEGIADILKKVYEKNKILEYKNKLVQHIDPIYEFPIPSHKFSFRTHFFAPTKHFMGRYFDTFWFNMSVIWILTAIFYVFLYFDVFKKLLTIGERLKRN
jgi:hypothetical protein